MRKGFVVLLAALVVVMFAAPAMADISFFGTSRVMPTYYDNFDFDDNAGDKPTVNEGGFTAGEHVRAELRLGWKAGGDKWKIFFIAEGDVIMEKDTADRSYTSTDAEKRGMPNSGAEFGIERVELTYAFTPALVLSTGWNIRAADIKTGGLLFGDDHPFIELGGKLTENLGYNLTYIIIQNREEFFDADELVDFGAPTATLANSPLFGDWRAYQLKFDANVGMGAVKATLSPLVLFSDNRDKNAKIYYYGIEGTGQIGMFKPSFEFIYADGEFRPPSTVDIKSYAAFAGIEAAVSKVFVPYVAFRYAKGDDNSGDTEAEGFVGITDIGRFTPLMGMDGNILGENLASGASLYNSPLYSYSPDRAGGGNIYGGIGNASSGNNPGQMLIAFGAKGAVSEALSYKAQVFMIWYDQTNNLLIGAGKPGAGTPITEDYAGTTFDLQLAYKFSNNFSTSFIYSAFVPGDGIKDQLASTADDTIAQLGSLTFAWTY
jgi:hypothetical protein